MGQYLPMNALRAFDAAARHGNFSRAAEELCITQGAVSRHIAVLETHLGIKLFVRKHRRIELTEEARRYHKRLQVAFDEIRSATSEICASSKHNVLKLRCLPTFAMRWLIPRLARFREQYPQVEIQVSTSQQSPANFEAQGIDASIEYGLGQWPGLEAKHLFDELLIVVCGPKLANGMPVPRYPHELDHHVLLHSLQRPDFWRQWLQTAGAPQVPANTGLRFENSGLACQAAIDGLGIAIVHLPLIERDLETGRLIAPFNLIVRNQMAFYLAYPTEKSDLPALVAFRAMAAR